MASPRLVLGGLANALSALDVALMGDNGVGSSSRNGGRRGTVAQDKRAARKRRNQLRARGQYRKAVR